PLILKESGGTDMEMFDGTFKTLEGSLDYASARNRTISNNISNVDTPNYKAKNVVFKNVLHNALTSSLEAKRTHPKHIPFDNVSTAQSFRTVTQHNTMYNHNGNNVDIDKE